MEENKNQEVVPENQEAKVESNVENADVKPVQENTDSNVNSEVIKEENKANSGKKKSKKIVVIAVIIAIIAVGVAVYFLVFARKTIDLAEFIDVKYTGYNGYARAEVTISKDLKEYLGDSKLYKKFIDKVELTAKDNEDLSNGDKLKIKVKISDSWLEKNKLKLKDDEVVVDVKDLEETATVDVFEGIEIELTGISPNIRMEVNNNNSDDFIRTVYYTLSQSYDLANGDTVTITANYSSYTAEEKGVVVEKDTMEYKIENQPEYVMKAENLNDSILDAIKPELLNNVKKQVEDSDSLVYYAYNQDYGVEYTKSEPELVNMYLLTLKDTSNIGWSDANRLYAIYKVVYTSKTNGATFDWYFVANTSKIAINSNGELQNKDELKYNVSNRWDDGKTEEEAYNDLINDQKTNYIIEAIKK